MTEVVVRAGELTAPFEGRVFAPDGWAVPEPGEYASAVLTPADPARFRGAGFLPNVTVSLVSPAAEEADSSDLDGVLLASAEFDDPGSGQRRLVRLVQSAVLDFVVVQLSCVCRTGGTATTELVVVCSAAQAEWAACATDFDRFVSGVTLTTADSEVSGAL